MATEHAGTAKTPPSTTSGRTKATAKVRRAPQRSGDADHRARPVARAASRYAAPTVAVVATGVVAAAAYVLKERVGAIVADALKRAMAVGTASARATHDLSDGAGDHARAAVDRILHAAGLEHRRPFRSVLLPAMGVAGGLVVGALVTHFFAPRLLAYLGTLGLPVNDVEAPHDEGGAPGPVVVSGVDGVRTNGAAASPVG